MHDILDPVMLGLVQVLHDHSNLMTNLSSSGKTSIVMFQSRPFAHSLLHCTNFSECRQWIPITAYDQLDICTGKLFFRSNPHGTKHLSNQGLTTVLFENLLQFSSKLFDQIVSLTHSVLFYNRTGVLPLHLPPPTLSIPFSAFLNRWFR